MLSFFTSVTCFYIAGISGGLGCVICVIMAITDFKTAASRRNAFLELCVALVFLVETGFGIWGLQLDRTTAADRYGEMSNNWAQATNALEKQTAQASNRVVDLDALNQPVTDISADVTIVLKGTNCDEGTPEGLGVASLGLHESETNLVVSNFGALTGLIADDFQKSLDNGHVGYAMHFHPLRIPRVLPREIGLTAAQAMQEIKVVTVLAEFIPKDAEVLSGNLEILINGSLRKRFVILPQKSFIVRELSFQTNTNKYGFLVIATNSMPIQVAPLAK